MTGGRARYRAGDLPVKRASGPAGHAGVTGGHMPDGVMAACVTPACADEAQWPDDEAGRFCKGLLWALPISAGLWLGIISLAGLLG